MEQDDTLSGEFTHQNRIQGIGTDIEGLPGTSANHPGEYESKSRAFVIVDAENNVKRYESLMFGTYNHRNKFKMFPDRPIHQL